MRANMHEMYEEWPSENNNFERKFVIGEVS